MHTDIKETHRGILTNLFIAGYYMSVSHTVIMTHMTTAEAVNNKIFLKLL